MAKQEPTEETKTKDHEGKKILAQHEMVITIPTVQLPRIMSSFQGFVDFIREQGVVGLAVGLVLGAQIKALVDQLVASFINPLVGLLLPGKGDLADQVFTLSFRNKTGEFKWGLFVAQLISFMAVAAIIYFLVKGLKLDRLDKKKEVK